MTIRCAECHRPMKHETESGYGPKCEAKRKPKGKRKGSPITTLRRWLNAEERSRDPRQIEFAFQEVA